MHSKQLAFVPQIDFGDLYVSLEDIPALYILPAVCSAAAALSISTGTLAT